jgi:hypothetical protein
MAADKKSFLLYCDQKGVWDKLNDDQAGKLIKHIIAYVNDENPTAPDFITELAFEPIKQQLKRDLKEWEEKRHERSLAGKAGAKARWQPMATDGNRINEMAKMAVNDNVNVTVNANVNGNVTVSDNTKTLDWFKNQIDSIFMESMKMNHKGKDIDQAIKDSYAHMAADPHRLARAEPSDCKKLLNTWLTNIKTNGNRNGFKGGVSETVPTFSGDYSSKL